MYMKLFVLFGLGALLFYTTFAKFCKNIPGDVGWPSISAFNYLNTSVDGQLIAAKPLAAPCHLKSSTLNSSTYYSFNAAQCRYISERWGGTELHETDPTSVQSINNNNDSCLPAQYASPSSPCSLAGLPVYVINATNDKQVERGVAFAYKHNIRMVIKNTGHDYLGKSAGGNALSIWVHYMNSISYTPVYVPKHSSSCCEANYSGPAMILGPGVRAREIYAAADKHGVVIVRSLLHY